MTIIETDIKGLYLLKPKIFKDNRGFFLEIYKNDKYIKKLIKFNFVQDNHSRSKKNVLRGLHFQITKPQAQLITVMRGHIFDVVVDLRKKAKTYGKKYSIILSEKNSTSLFIPAGFAHGFCTMAKENLVFYGCTNYRSKDKDDEIGILWNDSELKIKWPIKNPIISEKDRKLRTFYDFKKFYKGF